MAVRLPLVEMSQVAEILATVMTIQEITRAILIPENVTHTVAVPVHSVSQEMQATIHAVALLGAAIS
jgi:hypothetical protein